MSSAMTRPDIPSIVVHNGSNSSPSSPSMENPAPDISSSQHHPKDSLTEEESDQFTVEESSILSCEENSLVPGTPELSSPHPPSLPVTPPSPSPAVSPSSPTVSSPANSGSSPSHLIASSTPPSACSNTSGITCLASLPPQGPGPGGGSSGEGLSSSTLCAMTAGQNPIPPSGVVGGSCRSKSLELPSQRSTDSEKDEPTSGLMRHRQSGSKTKLLQRSHAMREDSSPPPEILDYGGSSYTHPTGPPPPGPPPFCPSNSLTVGHSLQGGAPPRRRLRQQGSSQGSSSFEGSSPCLSRDSSMEYTDSSGVDLVQFIIQTLHKNQKDRMLLLKIERELVNLVKDSKSHHKFPQMSSYQRMLVHRCAAFFGLEHNVDQVGTSVIVNKTRNTRLPEIRFKDYIRDELFPPDEPKRVLSRNRDFSSFEDSSNYKSPDRHLGCDSRRSKSFEEREEEYEKSFSSIDERFHDVRHHDRRNSHEEHRWHDCHRNWAFIEAETHRKHYDNHKLRPGRLPKVESLESHDLLTPRNLRPHVFKSHSFGGYSGGVTVLSRGDSVASNPPPSRLSKQDSTGSRFSDHSSSSGYKTQRQDTSSTNVSNTLSTTPSPTTGQHQHPSFCQHVGVWGGGSEGETQPVMWAVTDLEAVPVGALLINPQTGQPYMNVDGSIYKYDPMNPPPMAKVLATSPKISSTAKDKSKLFHDIKSESCDYDEGSEGTPSHSKGRQLETPTPKDPRKMPFSCMSRRSDDDDYPPVHSQSFPSHYFNSSDGRPFSRDSLSEVGSQLRGMSLSGSGGTAESSIAEVSHPMPASIPHGYVVHRQQYPQQPVFYVPPGSVPQAPIKYVYPHYQVAPIATPVQGASTTGSTLPGAPIGPHATPALQPMPSMGNIPTLTTMPPQPLPGSGPPPPGQNPVADATTQLPPSYMPSNYTLVAYPSSGLLNNVTSTAGGHESGGTTYYCQLPGAAAAALHPPTPAAVSAGAPGASVPVTPTSTATTFPMGLTYYTASNMGNNGGIYPPNGLQGFQGPFYGNHNHTAGGQAAPTPQSGVGFRPPSPPQTPCTQGVGMPLNLSSGGNCSVPPGQYIMLPSQHPSTPTSQAGPQIFTTYYRPQLQMMSGSTGTPPQPILQYGGPSSVPMPGPLTPHPPVFAKPFQGAPGMAPLVTSGCDLLAIKEETKRYGGPVPQSSGSGVAPETPQFSGGPSGTQHLLPRSSFSFMQSNVAGSSGGNFRTCAPLLIPGPPSRHLSSATPFTAFSFSNNRPKCKRQSRSTTRPILSNRSNSELSSTHFSPSHNVEPIDQL